MPIRHFTLGEATDLLPGLTEMLTALRRLRDEAVVKKARLDLLWKRLGEGELVLSALADEQRVLDSITERLVALAGEIESTGCVLRDLDAGLVDFPFRARGGATVFLCWRVGEPAIAFWHGADEGFAGRQPIARLPLDQT
ncbi:MAG TPA: DUF2203 domain-containing protein [bacterium]|nr:DUF2203 domain-containing protein [bacterium]